MKRQNHLKTPEGRLKELDRLWNTQMRQEENGGGVLNLVKKRKRQGRRRPCLLGNILTKLFSKQPSSDSNHAKQSSTEEPYGRRNGDAGVTGGSCTTWQHPDDVSSNR